MKFACFDIPTLPLGAFSPRAGGGMRLCKGDPVSDALDTASDIGQGAIDVVSDAGSAIDDAILQPVETAVENTVQAAVDDPIKTAAIAAAIATGQPELIPYIQGGDALAKGATPEEAVTSAAKAYAMQQAAGSVSSELSPEVGQTAGNAGGAATVAALTGGDPLQAAVNSGMNAGVNAGINAGVDAFNAPPTEQTSYDEETGQTTYRYDDGSTLIVDSEGNPVDSTDANDYYNNSPSNIRLPSANFFPSAVAAATGGASANTVDPSSNTSLPSVAADTADITAATAGKRPGAAADNGMLNPLLFSLAGFQAPQQQAAKDPFSDLALGTSSFDNTPPDHQMPTFAQGGLASAHPMGEPEFYSEGGLNNRYIKGEGDGTSDSIPAMVADSEFVMPADVVAALGNGSSDAGASKLDQMVQQIRKRARSTSPDELPPTAHESPLDYLKGRA